MSARFHGPDRATRVIFLQGVVQPVRVHACSSQFRKVWLHYALVPAIRRNILFQAIRGLSATPIPLVFRLARVV